MSLPLGVTGNTPDSGSGESWFDPRRGNFEGPLNAALRRFPSRRSSVAGARDRSLALAIDPRRGNFARQADAWRAKATLYFGTSDRTVDRIDSDLRPALLTFLKRVCSYPIWERSRRAHTVWPTPCSRRC